VGGSLTSCTKLADPLMKFKRSLIEGSVIAYSMDHDACECNSFFSSDNSTEMLLRPVTRTVNMRHIGYSRDRLCTPQPHLNYWDNQDCVKLVYDLTHSDPLSQIYSRPIASAS